MIDQQTTQDNGFVNRIIKFSLSNRFVVLTLLGIMIVWGTLVAPFDWKSELLERSPVPVDAIPDIGENQQIVFTDWPGRSPQDIDDQISYPLTVSLLGIPGVKDVRSYSVFGFSTIYIVFEDDIEFYWSRSRVLEKLSSLPVGTLPSGVSPTLGPDATALGQVFWYTLEGRDNDGNPTGGWDLDELRSIQDFIVKYQLASVEGVSEVASIGGFVREYQVDVDPDAMRASGVTLHQVIDAVRKSNLDVGARTLEINRAEYIVRGVGNVQSAQDLEQIAVVSRDGIPVLIGEIAQVGFGPALRRGVLTKAGTESVGGVVTVRYGENPMSTIQRIKEQIVSTASGLPTKILSDGTESRVTVVPFYDRSKLINETLGTLSSAIEQQVYITIIVVVLMIMHLRASLLVGFILPMSVLGAFICMKLLDVDANIVSLSGIAIAIGTIVDIGIVLSENILRKLEESDPEQSTIETVYIASSEVGGAVLTSIATTVISFLPVLTMEAAEGKLFKPLALTKTFALIVSIVLALTVLPVLAHALLGLKTPKRFARNMLSLSSVVFGVYAMIWIHPFIGVLPILIGLFFLIESTLPKTVFQALRLCTNIIVIISLLIVLARSWEPLGPQSGLVGNAVFITSIVGGVLVVFWLVRLVFPIALEWALEHKLITLFLPACVVLFGATAWLGFERVWGWLPDRVREHESMVHIAHAFPGFGSEFMPSLDEGAFLYMPTTMPHASIGEATNILKELDLRIMSIPEVESSIGKIGRVDSPLDPAPISMIETIIEYKDEYIIDEFGQRKLFARNHNADFLRDDSGALIEDESGYPFRQWRDEIQSPQDIWDELSRVAQITGLTSAPKLQPIETRVVMLQSGFRAPMGIKVFGPDLESIESFGLDLERLIKDVPSVEPRAVFADRVVGKPYLEIVIDREKIARYGVLIRDVQEIIEVAIGGQALDMSVEGRERYPIRVRYLRERRNQPETLMEVLVPAPNGTQIPLGQLADLEYRRGAQMIKSEDTFLVSYVLFDKREGFAEVSVVEHTKSYIQSKINSSELVVPPGVSFKFAGSYENQVRASKRMRIVLPLSLIVIFSLLYMQFKRIGIALMVFSGVFVAWGGGFIMLWLYAQPWFLDFDLFGTNMRELFQVQQYNLSIAVWVGFLALFGIATDDGVIMATRIEQCFRENETLSVGSIRRAVATGGRLRVRAAVMTSATTILALLPVLTSTGRGSDIMIPMAIPTFGGMLIASLTWFVVPVLYCWYKEIELRISTYRSKGAQE